MVGKNNFKNKMQAEAERKPHYGIRKFSIGVASVLLSTSLFFGISTLTSNSVKAATTEDSEKTTEQNENKTTSDLDLNISNDRVMDQKQETDSKQSVTDQTSDETVRRNISEEQKDTVKENKVADQTENNTTKESSTETIKQADSTKNTEILKTPTEKKPLTEDALKESKVPTKIKARSADTTVNGGYDQAEWGKLDVNDWTYESYKDGIMLNTYKPAVTAPSSATHIIIPNTADFINAGILHEGQNIYYNPESLYNAGANELAYAKTIAISKTDNAKIIWVRPGVNSSTIVSGTGDYLMSELPYVEKADLSNLDVSQETDFSYIFGGDTNLKEIIGLDQWQVKDATTFRNAFGNCSSLEKVTGVGNWVSDKTIDLSYMFNNDSSLQSIDSVKNWNTSNIESDSSNGGFANMFANNSSLKELNVSNWKIKGGADVDMLGTGPFAGCDNLNIIANGDFADYLVQFNKKKLKDNDQPDNGTVSWLKEAYFDGGTLGGHLTTSNWTLANAMKETNDPKPVPDDKKTTYTRTINYVYPEGYTGTKAASKTQTVIAVQKPIQVTFDHLDADEDNFDKVNPDKTVWSDDLKDSKDETKAAQFDEVAVPETSDLVAFEDGKQVSSVPSAAITKDTPDKQTVTITYKQKQSINVKFVDDDENGKQVGNPIKESGLAGQTVALNLSTPENYQLAEGQTLPSSYTFKTTGNDNIVIHLVHQTKQLKDGDTNPVDGTKIHAQTTRKYQVVENLPSGAKTLETKNVIFVRDIEYDLVTKQVISAPWTVGENSDLPDSTFYILHAVDQVDGYTAKLRKPMGNKIISGVEGYDKNNSYRWDVQNSNNCLAFYSEDSTTTYIVSYLVDQVNNESDIIPSQTFYIDYVANPQTNTYQFVDDDDNGAKVGSAVTINGVTDQTINLNYQVPANYVLASNQPTQYKFKAKDNQPLTIHLKHQIEDVTNDKTDKDPDTNRAYYDMCHVDREYKIVDKMPTPESNPTKYGNDKELLDWHLEFYCQATRDKVTGKVTYGVWKAKNGDGKEFLLNNPANVHTPWNSSDNTSATNGIISKQVSIQGIDGYGVIGTGNPVKNPNAIATFEGAPKGGGVTISANIAATQDELDNDAKGLANGVLASKTFYVEHVPLDQKVTVNFVDDDTHGNHVSDTQKSGKTDLHIEFTGKNALTIPSGYELAKNQPTGYTFNAQKDQQLTIHLVHKKDNVDKDHVPAGHTSDEFTKQIKRIIFAQIPNSTPKNLSQTISVDKTGVYDEVTKRISWNGWQNGTFAQVNAPQVDGYTPSQENVAEEKPSSDEIESWVDTAHITTITYKANQQQTTAKFVDDDENGKQVGDLRTLKGKTDETIPVFLTVPNNYKLAAGQMLPTGYKFKAKDNQPIVVHLVHQHSTPDGKEKDPNNENKIVQELTHQEVKRTITINNPDKSRNDKSQKVTLTRTADKDLVTGKITYGQWNTSSFEEVDVPPIAGYTPSQDKVDSVASVDVNYRDPNIVVNYIPNAQTGKISYVDEDGHEVGKTDLSGKTDEDISINPVAPKGWKISAGQNIPTSEKAKADGIPTVTVKVEHNKTKVPHDQPKKPGDKTPTGKDIDGAHEKDLNQTITRTINVTDQKGKTTTTTQVAKIYRDAEVDDVTGEVTYGAWSKDDQNWSEFDVPTIPGYTPSKVKVEKHTVENGDQDQTINITYSKIPASEPDNKPDSQPSKEPDKKPDINKKPHKKTPKPTPEKKHHKVTKYTKTPKKENKYNDIFGVHGQDLNMRGRRRSGAGQSSVTPLSERTGQNQSGTHNGATTKNDSSTKAELPQTGESQNKLGLIGLAFASIAALFGLAADRKRKN